jgi:hypothetical protein
MVYMRIDQIMLREMVGDRELGIYSAALPFSQAWHFIPVTICASLLPTLSRNHADNRALFFLRLQRLFILVAWLAIALVVGLALASNWLVTTLLGATYEETARVLSLHIVTNIFIFLGVAQGQWILNERRSQVSLIKTVIGAITNVVANLILIPLYGAVGGALLDPCAGNIQHADARNLSVTLYPPRNTMRIQCLVTGGAGFLGSHLCDRLIRDGYEVLCVDNFYTGGKNNIAHHMREARFELMRHACKPNPLPVRPRTDHQDQRARCDQYARARQAGESPNPAGLNIRDLRRSGGSPSD